MLLQVKVNMTLLTVHTVYILWILQYLPGLLLLFFFFLLFHRGRQGFPGFMNPFLFFHFSLILHRITFKQWSLLFIELFFGLFGLFCLFRPKKIKILYNIIINMVWTSNKIKKKNFFNFSCMFLNPNIFSQYQF